MTIFSRSGGPTRGVRLVLLHGLGGTADLWDGVIERTGELWPGPWTAVELPGHGRSDAVPAYSFGAHACAVAEALVAAPGPVVVLGHSMGGVVGLALASGWFGVEVLAAVGVGVKLHWTQPDLASMAQVAARGVRWFPTEEEARARFVLVNGLRGVLDPASRSCGSGVAAAAPGALGRWRLAHDPRSIPRSAPPIAGLLSAAAAPVTLAAGEGDTMAPAADAAAFGVQAEVLAGVGHNAHVEAPEVVLALARRHLTGG